MHAIFVTHAPKRDIKKVILLLIYMISNDIFIIQGRENRLLIWTWYIIFVKNLPLINCFGNVSSPWRFYVYQWIPSIYTAYEWGCLWSGMDYDYDHNLKLTGKERKWRPSTLFVYIYFLHITWIILNILYKHFSWREGIIRKTLLYTLIWFQMG